MYYYDEPRNETNGLAVASLVCGILSIVFPFFGFVLSIVAIVTGCIGLNNNNRGMAIAGIICGAAGILLNILYIVLFAIIINYALSNLDTNTASSIMALVF